MKIKMNAQHTHTGYKSADWLIAINRTNLVCVCAWMLWFEYCIFSCIFLDEKISCFIGKVFGERERVITKRFLSFNCLV